MGHYQTDDALFQEEPPKRSRSREDLRPVAPVTWEEYFSDEPLDKEIGRPRDIATKVQKFRATLWLCEDYPLEVMIITFTRHHHHHHHHHYQPLLSVNRMSLSSML